MIIAGIITFLFPNKKVTKEIGLRVAFYTDAPLKNPPPKPVRPAEFPLSSQMFRFAACRRGSHRKSAGDGAGGFLRGTRVERELGLAPLSRLLWGTFLAETRKVRKHLNMKKCSVLRLKHRAFLFV